MDACPLAGGHSLIPMMKLRMASPEHLVDVGRIPGLRFIRDDGDAIVIGATTTQAEMINSELLVSRLPIIRETSLQVADPQVRARGTLGGNVANGDPANDFPALMQCLDAVFVLQGTGGERNVPARGFYKSPFETELRAGELLTSVRIPVPPPGHGHAYEKLKRKVGDYATAAVAVLLTLRGGQVATCAISLTNVGPTPLFAAEASAIVIGTSLDPETRKRAATSAKGITDPATDGRGTAEYRREMAGVMVARALSKAMARAQGAA